MKRSIADLKKGKADKKSSNGNDNYASPKKRSRKDTPLREYPDSKGDTAQI